MVYKDYMLAAQRHRETCEYLIKKLKDTHEYIDVNCQKKLLQNVYYLSGYIIECMISHSFFNIINYDDAHSVYELDNHNSFGYTFQKYFREHSKNANTARIEEIRKRGGNIPSTIPIIGEIEIDDTSKAMYDEWDAKSRYSISHLSFQINHTNIYNFFKITNEVYSKLRKL